MKFVKYFHKNGDIRTREKYLLFPKSISTQSSKTTYWLCKVVITEKWHDTEIIRTKHGYYTCFEGWEVVDISECVNKYK